MLLPHMMIFSTTVNGLHVARHDFPRLLGIRAHNQSTGDWDLFGWLLRLFFLFVLFCFVCFLVLLFVLFLFFFFVCLFVCLFVFLVSCPW